MPSQPLASTVQCHVADVLVRRLCGSGGVDGADQSPSEVRVAIIGNVDSGKSTFVGVLTRSMLDDGRGLARSKVGKEQDMYYIPQLSNRFIFRRTPLNISSVLSDRQFRYFARALRAQVFKHAHEESTGRTSSIGQHTLCLDSTGQILNDSMFRCAGGREGNGKRWNHRSLENVPLSDATTSGSKHAATTSPALARSSPWSISQVGNTISSSSLS